MTTTLLPGARLGDEPKVEAFPLGNFDRKPQRHITFEWMCGTNDEGHEVRVQLSCYHHLGRVGRYTATLNNTVHTGDGMWCTAPTSATRTSTVECARYSKGAFEKFAYEALEELRGMADTELVREYLRGEHAPPR